MDILNEIIRKETKKALLEYMGISNTVGDAAKQMYDVILYSAQNYQHLPTTIMRQVETSDDCFREYHCKAILQPLGFIINHNDLPASVQPYINNCYLTIYYYNTNETDDFQAINNDINNQGLRDEAFSYKTKDLYLTFPFPFKGKLDWHAKSFIISVIRHEIKHAYQFSLAPNQFYQKDNTYQKATRHLNDVTWHEEQPTSELIIRNDIPWLYYFFDKNEIDAHLEQLYDETIQMHDVKGSPTYEQFIYYFQKYNKLLGYAKDYPDFFNKTAVSILGINSTQYLNYLNKMVDYAKKKFKKVIFRLINDIGSNVIKYQWHEAPTEIPQGNPFNSDKDIAAYYNKTHGLKDRIKQKLNNKSPLTWMQTIIPKK